MSQTTERIHELVEKLNRYRHEYYNEDAPSVLSFVKLFGAVFVSLFGCALRFR